MASRPVSKVKRIFGLHPAFLIIAKLGLIAVAALLIYDHFRHRDANVATAKEWDIKGPPCPSLTADEWAAKHLSAPKSFDYDGDTLARWAGDASCSDVKTNGGTGMGVIKVCQFAAPVSVTAKTKAGQVYFNPGVGQPVTLIIQDGVTRCVMGGKFTLKSEMGG
jgi:hypothetical protein